MTTWLIFPHQLFEDIDTLKNAKHIYLIEHPLFFSQYKLHKLKLILHRATMKMYEDYLKNNTNATTLNLINHTALPQLIYMMLWMIFYCVICNI